MEGKTGRQEQAQISLLKHTQDLCARPLGERGWGWVFAYILSLDCLSLSLQLVTPFPIFGSQLVILAM